MTTNFEAIDLCSLDHVTGGAGVGAQANLDVKGDVSQTIRDVGNGFNRYVGCATGASSLREFGNCVLTGHLGGVPSTASSPAGQ